MASWQERIQKALSEQRLREQQAELARRKQEQQRETERQQEREQSEHQRRIELQKAKVLLGKIGAREMLEYIKRDIWKVGEIITEQGDLTVAIALEWRRNGGAFLGGGTGPGGGVNPAHWETGIWGDKLSLTAIAALTATANGKWVYVDDLHYFKPASDPKHWEDYSLKKGKSVYVEADDYLKARNDVEQVIAEFCETRIGAKKLPREWQLPRLRGRR